MGHWTQVLYFLFVPNIHVLEDWEHKVVWFLGGGVPAAGPALAPLWRILLRLLNWGSNHKQQRLLWMSSSARSSLCSDWPCDSGAGGRTGGGDRAVSAGRAGLPGGQSWHAGPGGRPGLGASQHSRLWRGSPPHNSSWCRGNHSITIFGVEVSTA